MVLNAVIEIERKHDVRSAKHGITDTISIYLIFHSKNVHASVPVQRYLKEWSQFQRALMPTISTNVRQTCSALQALT